MDTVERQALEFLKNGDYAKAAELYVQLALGEPDNEKYLLNAARCYERNEESKKAAVGLYKKILTLNPQSFEALSALSNLYYGVKKYEKSADYAQQALALQPENFATQLTLANTLYAQGRFTEALGLYDALLALKPDSYIVLLNLANTHYSLAHFEKAFSYAEQAVDKRPSSFEPYVIAGNSLVELNRLKEAYPFLKRASELAPDSAWVCGSISSLFQQLENWKQGLHYAWKALSFKNKSAKADDFINFGYALYEAKDEGEDELVDKYLTRFEEKFPQNPIAHYISASLRDTQDVTSGDLDYIKTLFDGFAPSFDGTLAELDYQVPQLMASAVKDSSFKTAVFKKRRILDLGCGTGLCAEALREFFPRAEYVGVDISERMLAMAEAKNIYQELYASDIESFFADNATLPPYDLIVSGDVFTYMGTLKPVLKAIAQALKFNGFLCFSISKNIFNQNDFYLTPSGRFVHSIAYVCRLLKYFGFEVQHQQEAFLRHEGRKDIEGYIIVAKKTLEIVYS
jgi:predicted TPR repeat methyltransferase